MIACLRLVNIRVIQRGPVFFVDIRYGCRTLEVKDILAPAYADTGSHSGDAGLFRVLSFRLIVRHGDFNLAVGSGSNLGIVDFCAQSFLIAVCADGGIGNRSADAHFCTAHGHAACHGGLLHQLTGGDRKILHAGQHGIACRLAIDDTFRMAYAAIDGNLSGGFKQTVFGSCNFHAARHGQRLAGVVGCQLDGVIVSGQRDFVIRQIGAGGVVEGIVSKGQAESHAISSGHLSGNIDDVASVDRHFTDVFTCNRVILKGDFGIVLEVVPTAGTCSVESFAANGSTRAHGNDKRIVGRRAVQIVCLDDRTFDICRNVVLHIIVGNARAGAGVACPAPRHGGGDGTAVVGVRRGFLFGNLILGGVLIICGLVRNLALIGILAFLIQCGFGFLGSVQIVPAGSVYAFIFKRFLVFPGLFIIKFFIQLFPGFLAFFLCVIVFEQADGFRKQILNRSKDAVISLFAGIDVYCSSRDACAGNTGNVSMGAVFHAAVGKRAVETVAAGPAGLAGRQSAGNLDRTLLRLHVNVFEIRITAADDAGGQIVFQTADGNRAAYTHIDRIAAGGIGRKTAGNLIIRACCRVGNIAFRFCRTGHGVVDHQGMDILVCLVEIHHARAADVRAVALIDVESHTGRHFDTGLGGGVGDRLHLFQLGVANQRVHVAAGFVHGEGAADTRLAGSRVLFHGMFNIRAAQGD